MDELTKWQRREKRWRRRKELRERVIQHLGGKCQICGYDRCQAALDCHHIHETGKEANVSEILTSWTRVLKEIDKCVLLCSNCHREVHDGLHPGYLSEWVVDNQDAYQELNPDGSYR